MTTTKATAARKAELAAQALARRSLYHFGVIMGWRDEKTAPFHRTMVDVLEAVARFELTKVIFVAPPRHGKTKWVSEYFPAWALGNQPSMKLIAASYSADLAEQNGNSVRRLMAEPKYRDAFGDMTATFKGARATAQITDLKGGGYYKAVGVGGSFAGFGGNWLVIDDPFKNRKEADSPTIREDVWNWYNDDALTRMEWPRAVVIMHTRWHEDDLVGRILQGPDAHEWSVFHWPQVQDDIDCDLRPYDKRKPGEALWPRMFYEPDGKIKVKDAEAMYIEEYKRALAANDYGVRALRDGRPYTKGGGLFQEEWFNRYTSDASAIVASAERIYIGVDATYKATKRSDRVGIVVVARRGARYFVIEAGGHKMSFQETRAYLGRKSAEYPQATVVIEAMANGQALIEDLRSVTPSVASFDPGNESKASRVEYAASIAASGNLWWPTDQAVPAIREAIDECMKFGATRYDDIPDAISMCLLHDRKTRSYADALRRQILSPSGSPAQFLPGGLSAGLLDFNRR